MERRVLNLTDKPLGDVTLRELQEYCKTVSQPEDGGWSAEICDACLFCHCCCKTPDDWELEEKPQFTPDELAVMRAAKNGGVEEVSANSPAGDYLYLYDGRNGYIGRFPSFLLPSLRYGQKVKLDEIDLGEGDLDD